MHDTRTADCITQVLSMMQERREDHEPPAPTAPRDRFFRARATRPRGRSSALFDVLGHFFRPIIVIVSRRIS